MEIEEDRQMSNEIVNYNPGQASLLEMRADFNRFPRIKTMPREQVVMGMAKIVSQAFLYRGQAADPTNIQFISSALVQELLEDDKFGSGYLSLAEIQVVVKRAVLGGSELFGISVASLYKVIIEFVKGEGHLNQTMVNMSRRKEALQPTAVSVRLQAATGNFVKNHKI